MSATVLDQIPFEVTLDALIGRLKLQNRPSTHEDLAQLLQFANSKGHPKVMYREALIAEKGEDFIIIDGIKLTSSGLREKLGQVDRIYPFIVTCGVELGDWAASFTGTFTKYCAGAICELAMFSASNYFNDHFKEHHPVGKVATLRPGSLRDWTIRDQEQIFTLLGDPSTIGVTLTERCMMSPIKSVSGIRYATDEEVEDVHHH